jgi:hypothetical protein
MKIELTMTELMLIVDMIKNGTEKDNEGTDTYTLKELYDAFINGVDTKLKCTDCGSTDEVMLSATRNFNAYCKKCTFK